MDKGKPGGKIGFGGSEGEETHSGFALFQFRCLLVTAIVKTQPQVQWTSVEYLLYARHCVMPFHISSQQPFLCVNGRTEVACSGLHPDLLTQGLWTDVVPRVDIEGRVGFSTVLMALTWRRDGDYLLACQACFPCFWKKGLSESCWRAESCLTFSKQRKLQRPHQ